MMFLEFVEEDLFVSTKWVKKGVKYGALVFTVLISFDAKDNRVISDLPVVCEFLEVFPEHISDFPPEREVKYMKNIVHGIGPV